MFSWLPIGNMIAHSGSIPKNFLEVDGQRLHKLEYPIIFNTLKGCVVDDGDFFVLPKKESVMAMFSTYTHTKDFTVIIRVA